MHSEFIIFQEKGGLLSCFLNQFQGRLSRKVRGLPDAIDPLKEARDSLVSRLAAAELVSALSTGVDNASSELQAACQSAFLTAKAYLHLAEAQSKNNLLVKFDKKHLLETANNLLYTVDTPYQYRQILKLCELREALVDAVRDLTVTATVESSRDYPVLCNLTVTDSWQIVSVCCVLYCILVIQLV
ncbi:unnamed protein product [Dibothriocephalus latus]|uniref:Uncharacterized protein n=1 Tax=Dibothriocephalus latus TaxID=60516 RepID=A0A3P7PFF9_DIBLA|nr:unnamed protein product [Dibothriocephalus latus]